MIELLIKVAKFVYFGMKEYTSLSDVVSEEIDNVDLNCLYVWRSLQWLARRKIPPRIF